MSNPHPVRSASRSQHVHLHGSVRNLKLAFFLNLGFTAVEIVGGLWTNSVAILADAMHDFGDSASLGLAWYFERLSERGITSKHTYGYKRYRLLGGLVTGLVLVVGLAVVLWQAAGRLASPEPVYATGMMGLASVGVLVNGVAVLRMRQGRSLTERVVSWHLLEDTLAWVAVLVAACVMAVWNLPIIDPLLSIGISLFVLWNVGRNLARVAKVFLQFAPTSFDLTEFEEALKRVPRIRDIHHAHVWSLDGESHVLSMHLVMPVDASREEIVEAKKSVLDRLDPSEFVHVTIEVELEGEECALGGDAATC